MNKSEIIRCLVIVTLAMSVVASHKETHACSCTGPIHKYAIKSADVIFIGTVYEIEKPTSTEEFYTKYHFNVDAVWKGNVTKDYTVLSYGSASCGYIFMKETSYLVYIKNRPDSLVVAEACRGIQRVENALLDRYLLGSPKNHYLDSYKIVELNDLFYLLNTDQSKSAAYALSNLGSQSETIIPLLVDYALGYRPGNSVHALEALHSFGQSACKYVPELIKLYKGDRYYDPETRAQCIVTLYSIAENKRIIRPYVRAGLTDPNWQIRAASCRPAWDIIRVENLNNRNRFVKVFLRNLQDENSMVRLAALKYLGGLRNIALQNRSRIGNMMNDPDPKVRHQAENTLRYLDLLR